MAKYTDAIIAFFAAGMFAAIIVYILKYSDSRIALIMFGFPISFTLIVTLLWFSTKSRKEVQRLTSGVIVPVAVLYAGFILLLSVILPYTGLLMGLVISWLVWIVAAYCLYRYLGRHHIRV